jgi:tRNA(fMet)-specific endonuclease VapC
MKRDGNYLLDTTAAIGLAEKDAAVIAIAKSGLNVFLPIIAVAEMYFGAYHSGRVSYNLDRVKEFAIQNVVLGCDDETARNFGQIKQELRSKGRPIPENDIWIAAIARQHDLAVLTRDKHFQEVDDLGVIGW